MRELADAERIHRFMRTLGSSADSDGACYLTSGATPVLLGWRPSTSTSTSASSPRLTGSCERFRSTRTSSGSSRARVAGRLHSGDAWLGKPEPVRLARRKADLLPLRSLRAGARKVERAHSQDLADVDAMLERAASLGATMCSPPSSSPSRSSIAFRRSTRARFGGGSRRSSARPRRTLAAPAEAP